MDLKNQKLETITCYLDHSSMALKQVDSLFSEEDGDLVIKDVEDWLALVRMGYSTLVSTLEDCSGKTVKIQLGDSLLANTIEGLLTGLLEGKLIKSEKV